MPINSRKLGPGVLTLGTGAMAVESQLTKARLNISESVTQSGEKLKVLSGETKDGTSETIDYAFTLDGTFLQDDPGVASVVDWSWDNAGTEQPFVFVPNTAGMREVSGTLVPVHLSIGGDDIEETDMASDFTWRIKGEPTRGTVGP
jgi:hypothetical protein